MRSVVNVKDDLLLSTTDKFYDVITITETGLQRIYERRVQHFRKRFIK